MAELQPDSSWLQESVTPLPAPAPEAASPAAAPEQAPARPLDPTVQAWRADPEFNTLPPSEQSRIVGNYAQHTFSQQDGFTDLGVPQRQNIIQNFVSAQLEGGSSVRLPITSAVRGAVGPSSVRDNASRVPLSADVQAQDASDNPNPFQQSAPATQPVAPVQDYRGPDQGFTPQQSAMFGPQARQADDQAQAFPNPNLNPAVASAGAASLQKERATGTGPQYSVRDENDLISQVPEGPARKLASGAAIGAYVAANALLAFPQILAPAADAAVDLMKGTGQQTGQELWDNGSNAQTGAQRAVDAPLAWLRKVAPTVLGQGIDVPELYPDNQQYEGRTGTLGVPLPFGAQIGLRSSSVGQVAGQIGSMIGQVAGPIALASEGSGAFMARPNTSSTWFRVPISSGEKLAYEAQVEAAVKAAPTEAAGKKIMDMCAQHLANAAR